MQKLSVSKTYRFSSNTYKHYQYIIVSLVFLAVASSTPCTQNRQHCTVRIWTRSLADSSSVSTTPDSPLVTHKLVGSVTDHSFPMDYRLFGGLVIVGTIAYYIFSFIPWPSASLCSLLNCFQSYSRLWTNVEIIFIDCTINVSPTKYRQRCQSKMFHNVPALSICCTAIYVYMPVIVSYTN